jgi:hypothetical protein
LSESFFMTPDEQLNEWRIAARAAFAAEKVVSDAFVSYFSNKGAAPTRAQLDEAARRREIASDLFHVVMGRSRTPRTPDPRARLPDKGASTGDAGHGPAPV